MQIAILALLLAGIFAFFCPSVQRRARVIGQWIWALPLLFTTLFAGAAAFFIPASPRFSAATRR